MICCREIKAFADYSQILFSSSISTSNSKINYVFTRMAISTSCRP
jgi:hypothetical protein